MSNIPILGNLFRFDHVDQERRELLILLTPHIVRDENDADRIKQIEAARMSWCLGDVIKVHGPSGLRTRYDDFSNAETTVVYPGMHMGTPTPAGPEIAESSDRRSARASTEDPGADGTAVEQRDESKSGFVVTPEPRA